MYGREILSDRAGTFGRRDAPRDRNPAWDLKRDPSLPLVVQDRNPWWDFFLRW
jgi:hypothetical protein